MTAIAAVLQRRPRVFMHGALSTPLPTNVSRAAQAQGAPDSMAPVISLWIVVRLTANHRKRNIIDPQVVSEIDGDGQQMTVSDTAACFL